MKCYAVYSYDTMEYSDMSDWYFKVFVDKEKAQEYVKKCNEEAWEEKEEWESEPSDLFDMRELEMVL